MSKTKKKFSSWKDFPINDDILDNLKKEELSEPTPIQIRALRATLIQDKHVLGAAQTGSGKTLAYTIPMINLILNNNHLGQPCSILKERISKHLSKREDFELIDGEMVSVEDMIVDKDLTDETHWDVISDQSDDEEPEDRSDSESQFSCPEAIVLVPTRELAIQVKQEVDRICQGTFIKSCCLIGGMSQDKQLRRLKERPHVIIATPGRLYDIVQSGENVHLNVQSIASIRTLVIDEADRMVQKGHFEEMIKIIDIMKDSKKFRKLKNFGSDVFKYRVYLFSATLTFLHELPDRFKMNALKKKETRSKGKSKKIVDPNEHTKKNKILKMMKLLGIERHETRIIDLNNDTNCGRPDSSQLHEYKINCLAHEKDLYLYYFLLANKDRRTLVFCNSKDCLRRLTNVLKFLGHETMKLHAEMDQKKRLSSLERFRKNNGSIMVATDVAARGLDIKDLDCVVHYQVPKTCESYIHRSGRTARLFNKGTSLTLCEPKEAPYYRRLCNNINSGKDLDNYDVDIDLKNLIKERVELAQRCDKIDHELREVKSDRNWFSKAAKECEIELDEDELRHLVGRGKGKQQNVQDEAKKRRLLSQLQKQLSSLMKRSLVTRSSRTKKAASKLIEDEVDENAS